MLLQATLIEIEEALECGIGFVFAIAVIIYLMSSSHYKFIYNGISYL
jgi:hypothetical protein